MKKVIFASIIILIILVVASVILTNYFMHNVRASTYPQLEEATCNRDSDCTLSTNHPGYPKGVCVNKEWQDNWNKNVESQKYEKDCIAGVYCSGPEAAKPDFIMPQNCHCVDKYCQPTDLTNHPGCSWADC